MGSWERVVLVGVRDGAGLWGMGGGGGTEGGAVGTAEDQTRIVIKSNHYNCKGGGKKREE